VFDPARFYRPPEIVLESHAPKELVYEALNTGELRAIRRGSRWLVPGSSVLEWINAAPPKDRP
jgi:excisionase family DNA binding protein